MIKLTKKRKPGKGIIDNSKNVLIETIPFYENGTIETMQVSLDLEHPSIGDLVIKMRSPSGLEVLLHNREAMESTTLNEVYDQEIMAPFADSNLRGNWTLIVEDQVANEEGILYSWSIGLDYFEAEEKEAVAAVASVDMMPAPEVEAAPEEAVAEEVPEAEAEAEVAPEEAEEAPEAEAALEEVVAEEAPEAEAEAAPEEASEAEVEAAPEEAPEAEVEAAPEAEAEAAPEEAEAEEAPEAEAEAAPEEAVAEEAPEAEAEAAPEEVVVEVEAEAAPEEELSEEVSEVAAVAMAAEALTEEAVAEEIIEVEAEAAPEETAGAEAAPEEAASEEESSVEAPEESAFDKIQEEVEAGNGDIIALENDQLLAMLGGKKVNLGKIAGKIEGNGDVYLELIKK